MRLIPLRELDVDSGVNGCPVKGVQGDGGLTAIAEVTTCSILGLVGWERGMD